MITGSMIATGFYPPWDQLSDAGNWVVILFGMLLWLVSLFSLFGLGMRIILTGRDKHGKHKRGGRAKQRG
jgi:hypothetical protein